MGKNLAHKMQWSLVMISHCVYTLKEVSYKFYSRSKIGYPKNRPPTCLNLYTSCLSEESAERSYKSPCPASCTGLCSQPEDVGFCVCLVRDIL